MKKFSERLREAMNVRGMTQAQLSRVTNIDKGQLSHYIKGTYKAKQENLDTLASALRVSIPWLMGCDVPMESTINIAPDELTNKKTGTVNLSAKEIALVRAYRNNPSMQEAVDRILGICDTEPTVAEDIAESIKSALSRPATKK